MITTPVQVLKTPTLFKAATSAAVCLGSFNKWDSEQCRWKTGSEVGPVFITALELGLQVKIHASFAPGNLQNCEPKNLL